MKPMKLTDVGTDVEEYINDPSWVMQQKMDGARVMVIYSGGNILFTNDGEKPIAFSAAKLKLPALEVSLRTDFESLMVDEIILDGELIIEDGIYHVFDVISLSREGRKIVDFSHTLLYRLEELARLTLQSNVVVMASTAYASGHKRELWEAINLQGVEGAISKHLGSLYEPGTRTKQWVKHKLVKSADVVVAAVERKFDHKGMVTHGSAALVVPIHPDVDPEPWQNEKGKRVGMNETGGPDAGRGKAEWYWRPRTALPVGNASLIGKDLSIEAGSVVEIEYLYWTGKAVIQPRITRKREDKEAFECDLDQFPLYSRAAVVPEVSE